MSRSIFSRPSTPEWPNGNRAQTRALIALAAETGSELELADFPTFRFVPDPERASPPVIDAKPSTRRLHFKRKPHMSECKHWRPKALEWGALDYTAPMCGDPPELTAARKKWAEGDPAPLRAWLELQGINARARAQADARPRTLREKLKAKGCKRGPLPEEPARAPKRTSGRLVRALTRKAER